mmetsp:Transcript_74982/g.124908  ORF Transcript_74982/g.124908 Transcript_74982/m.124908 type:complete len:110 (-) Transcript_74982:1138-1467(-)
MFECNVPSRALHKVRNFFSRHALHHLNFNTTCHLEIVFREKTKFASFILRNMTCLFPALTPSVWRSPSSHAAKVYDRVNEISLDFRVWTILRGLISGWKMWRRSPNRLL